MIEKELYHVKNSVFLNNRHPRLSTALNTSSFRWAPAGLNQGITVLFVMNQFLFFPWSIIRKAETKKLSGPYFCWVFLEIFHVKYIWTYFSLQNISILILRKTFLKNTYVLNLSPTYLESNQLKATCALYVLHWKLKQSLVIQFLC